MMMPRFLIEVLHEQETIGFLKHHNE